MDKLTILKTSQCFGPDKLEIFKKRGLNATITDYYKILGGLYESTWLEKSKGMYWTKPDEENDEVVAVDFDGNAIKMDNVNVRNIGIRLALPISSIDNIPNNGKGIEISNDGILEVEYGYIPDFVVSEGMQKKLKKAYNKGLMAHVEGGKYTFDKVSIEDVDHKFSAYRNDVYKFEGRKYVPMFLDKYKINGKKIAFSCDDVYKLGKEVWVSVNPLRWLVDKKEKLMVTEKILFAGIQYNNEPDDKKFEDSNLQQYIDEYVSKEITQFKVKQIQTVKSDMEINEEEQSNAKRKTRLEKLNPDTTELDERIQMTDTQIIRNWIESGESVLLRGPSGIGKTERIKSLYPNLIYMKLTNNMFPEKVVGSTNLQTGQSIPPDFARNVILQEATDSEKKAIEDDLQKIYDIADQVYERSKESNKKVVILLDELLNVKPAVQSLVYTLVLNRMVEIGKGLKLPDNVVIVATGNPKKYSNSAEDLAKPLQKRFDHIIDMKPKVGEWLTEYAIPEKIHPVVIGYIFSKYVCSGKSEKIKDIGYFYEEPEVGENNLNENGDEENTNDPRSWTSISNILYNFENNLNRGVYLGLDVDDILKKSINTKLRMEWATDFLDFYNSIVLTPEAVVAGMGKGYSKEDLPKNINERFSCMVGLIGADENQVEACRNFIRENCDAEYLSIYDIYWASNDERRMEKIAELQELELSKFDVEEAKKFVKEGIDAYKEIGKMYVEYHKKLEVRKIFEEEK